jgi:hypothetical protein
VSILKSPLTIFGILLILAAGALGLGPYFINWNDHKAEFQRQASLVTGRNVIISGPVNVRLFPWPRLTASDVRISNPPGSLVPDLLRVEGVDAEISAPALLSGRIEFRKVKLLRPVLALERLANGNTSWSIDPARSLKGLPGADQIAVAGIDIEDGQLLLGDGRRGGLSQVTQVSGRLSAPALDGPWRVRLDAGQDGTPFSLNASTGKYRPGEPLNVSVSITPRDDTGFSWTFDGETLRDDGTVKGRLIVAPALLAGGKSNPLDSIWQIRLTSNLTADFDSVRLRDIEVVPATDLASGNLVTGEADITLGEQLKVDARLAAAELDVDRMLGRNIFAMPVVPNGNGQAGSFAATPLNTIGVLLQSLPQRTTVNFDATIASVVVGGETLTRVKLAGSASPDNLRIASSSATLPGQTSISFSGLVLPGIEDTEPQLAGELQADSVSLRDLAVWAMPSRRQAIEDVWTGSRGRASITGQLGLTPDTFRLSAIKARLDGSAATGAVRITEGTAPSVSIRLVSEGLNIDRYAPRGFSSTAIEGGVLNGLTEIAAGLLAHGDAQVTMQSDRLVLHGVEAHDIAIDVDISEGAVELRTIEIGAIGDARLNITGVLNFPEQGVSGSILSDLKASDPRPFLRLTGLLDATSAQTPWASRLGPVDLKILSEVSTAPAGTSINATLKGKAAGADVTGTGTFKGDLQDWTGGTVSLSASASGASSASLVALAGLEPSSAGEQPASLKFSFSGKPSSALNGTARLEAFDTALGFDGGLTISPAGSLAASGRTTLDADDASGLIAALGLPPLDWPDSIARTLTLSADTVLDVSTLNFTGIEARLPANTASGSITLSGSLRAPRVDTDLALATLDAGWLMGLLAGTTGADNAGSATFDMTRLGWLDTSLKLTAQRATLLPGLSLSDATAAIARTGDNSFTVDVTARTGTPDPLSASFTMTADGPLLALDGKLSTGLSTSNLLQGEDGIAALSGPVRLELGFAGSGRSSAGLISQLSGEGTLSAPAIEVPHLSLATLLPRLNQLDSVDGLDQVITESLSAGAITAALEPIPVSFNNGILRTSPASFTTPNGTGSLRLTSDLAAARTRIDISIQPEGDSVEDGTPGLSMRLSGHPQALDRSYDAGALKTWVTTNVLQRGMDQLEELQREEQRLIEEERKFREEQEQREAARRQRIIEQRQAAESARRRAAEEQQRLRSAEDARRRIEAEEERRRTEEDARRRLEEEEAQQKLEDLIRQNLPSEIPADAIISPGSGATQAPAN